MMGLEKGEEEIAVVEGDEGAEEEGRHERDAVPDQHMADAGFLERLDLRLLDPRGALADQQGLLMVDVLSDPVAFDQLRGGDSLVEAGLLHGLDEKVEGGRGGGGGSG